MASPHKTISISTAIEKNKIASAVSFLLTLDVTVVDPATGDDIETLRIVKNTEDLTINGNLYTAAEFDINLSVASGQQPTVTLGVTDYARVLLAKLETHGGGVGFRVIVGIVRSDALTGPPEVQEFFEVVGSSASDYRVEFQLGAENPLMKLFPRRLQTKNYCAWRYKDPGTCGYTGGLPSCDLTLNGPNGCTAHSNQANFGAFPGINNSGARYS